MAWSVNFFALVFCTAFVAGFGWFAAAKILR
jgi:hypothetical protein